MEECLSSRELELLVRLRNLNAFDGNAQPAWTSGASDWQEAKAAALSLISLKMANGIPNSEAPGIVHLELTSNGVGKADTIIENGSIRNRILRVNWLGWLTLIVAGAAAYFAYTGPRQVVVKPPVAVDAMDKGRVRAIPERAKAPFAPKTDSNTKSKTL